MIRVLFFSLILTKTVFPTIAKNANATNAALLISYGVGQPKIAEEFEIMKRVVKHPWIDFDPLILEDELATRENILKASEELSRKAGVDGTLMLVFDGWSVEGPVDVGDRIIVNGSWLPLKDVFEAIRNGRKELGSLARFVFLFLGDKTYKNLEKYSKSDFYNEFIGLGMEQMYLVTHEAFESALLKIGAANGSMEDFRVEIESKAKADKARLFFYPPEIKFEKLR